MYVIVSTVDSVHDKVKEVDIPQKHIEALERVNAITIMDRLTYNVHKRSINAEEVRIMLFVYICMCCVYGSLHMCAY